jgi:hypothetical protein
MQLHASGTWGVAWQASRAPPNLAYASCRTDCKWDRYSVLFRLLVDAGLVCKPCIDQPLYESESYSKYADLEARP